ncbi:MAG: DUF1127 domain-containing protein [Pseudomonadota bacterium]
MATFDTSRTTYGAASASSRSLSVFARFMSAFRAWNEARMTRNALSALSDRELEDIGLVRGDIDNMVEATAKR